MNPCKKWNKTEHSDFSNLTYRAVKWCFTRNAILRSYIIHYSNKRYIYDCEFYRNVLWLYLHEKIVCYRNRLDHLVQKQLLFLNLLLHLGLSLGFFIFFIFCRYVLNARDLPASTSEVQCGGWKWFGQVHEPWNSMEPTMTNPRNELHSLDRASHMHSDRCDKKMKNIRISRDSPEWSNK